MSRKETRISEIMTENNVDRDVAETLFVCELEERYPNETDLDTLEVLFETE